MEKNIKTTITSKRILIVDDEPLIRLSLAKLFQKIAEVKTASSAEEALIDIDSQFYYLCFLDINLPGMNGLDAMKIIKNNSPKTKVAIMTGGFLNEAMKEQITDHAYAFVEKPFDSLNMREIAESAKVTMN
jgi:DNA-binding NtrC family response regulator